MKILCGTSEGLRHVSMKQISNVTTFSAVMQWWGGVAVFCCHSFKFLQSRCSHFTQFLSLWPDKGLTERVLVVRLWSSLFGSTLGIPSNGPISLLWVIFSLWVSARVLSCGCNIWTSSVRRHPHHIRRRLQWTRQRHLRRVHPPRSLTHGAARLHSAPKLCHWPRSPKHRLSLQERLYNS